MHSADEGVESTAGQDMRAGPWGRDGPQQTNKKKGTRPAGRENRVPHLQEVIMPEKRRKPYHLRALLVRGPSRRFRAGTRRNKRHRDVGSFKSDKAES